jgi:hypothetical protein
MNADKEIKLGQLYKINMNKRLGKGAFGELFYGINIKTNEEIAAKRVHNPNTGKRKNCKSPISLRNKITKISPRRYRHTQCSLLFKR